jgi:hypothetical protein
MSSRFFNAWQYLTPNKLIVKLPLQYPMRAQDYAFNQMEICHQGNQIILTFDNVSKISKESENTFSRYESLRTEHSDKADKIWR